jgi:hypothetical protein
VDILLIVLLLVILLGGGWGYRSGAFAVGYNPFSLILLVLVVIIILGLFAPWPGHRVLW